MPCTRSSGSTTDMPSFPIRGYLSIQLWLTPLAAVRLPPDPRSVGATACALIRQGLDGVAPANGCRSGIQQARQRSTVTGRAQQWLNGASGLTSRP
jgi:hypothetical protein